jgi:hypothetical protein
MVLCLEFQKRCFGRHDSRVDARRKRGGFRGEESMSDAKEAVINDILRIMRTYHEQEASRDGVGTPGGLEHMGDVWRLFAKWEAALKGGE